MTKHFLTKDTPQDFETMISQIKAMLYHGGALEIDVKIVKDKRTHAQNALMWAFNRHIGKVYGADAEYVHEGMKIKLLPLEFVFLGDRVTLGNSTSALNKDEFTDYLQRYEADCASNGIILPAHPMYSEAMGRE